MHDNGMKMNFKAAVSLSKGGKYNLPYPITPFVQLMSPYLSSNMLLIDVAYVLTI